MIEEVIITTQNQDGTTHIAPMGIWLDAGMVVIAPFKPSTTLQNIDRNKTATVNRVDDVRIFAGCLTGRNNWPCTKTDQIIGARLTAALSHVELTLQSFVADSTRPRCYFKNVYEATHAPFKGFNRAQAAVLEATILVSRLQRLSEAKIKQEIEYLTIAIDKTAGEREQLAWQWLMEKITAFQNGEH